jgi:hypothetical protein
MMSFGKFKMTDCIVPALCLAVVVFMMAQLVIITVLGVSFKGIKQYSAEDSSITKSSKQRHGTNKRPPYRLSAKQAFAQVPSGSCPGINSSRKNSGSRKNSKGFSPQHVPLLNNPTSWPPVENRLYPDMELYNQDGELTRLSDFTGNVLVVQPVAMACPLSQAYSGANKKGKTPFKKCFPCNGVIDFAQRMNDYTGINIKTPGLVFVQILFYNMQNEPPCLDDAKQWAEHFDLRTSNNQYVLVATPEMVTRKSAMLIPGFQLIDRTFNLRSDSTGILPKRNLYLHFFPTLQSVFRGPQVLTNQIGAAPDSRTTNNSF